MKKIMNKNGFTLIELLVVIAIIAMLLAIVIPSMRKAKEYAKKVLCKSDFHQIGLAIGNYETSSKFNFRNNTKWYFQNGTGDMPYEGDSQPKLMRDLIATGMLPNREVFFCPGIANVSYDKNYLRNEVIAGTVRRYQMSTIETRMEDPAFTDRPAFWSSYCYLWKKRRGPDNPTIPGVSCNASVVNNISSGVLFCDTSQEIWELARDKYTNADSTLLRNLQNAGYEVKQTIPHFMALMQDYSVVNPADNYKEVCQWLWGTDTWAGL
jgi:prepilin-type N-terminal cleavage/methylation domain-containing protein